MNTENEVLTAMIKIERINTRMFSDLMVSKQTKEEKELKENIFQTTKEVFDILKQYHLIIKSAKKTTDYKEFLTMILKEVD